MKNLQFFKVLNLIIRLLGNVRNIFALIILTRLLFVEPSQMALFLEILGTGAIVLTPDKLDTIDD